jgi:glucose-6-phosphate dehydrogenase assembly protein OpcA
MKHAFLYLGWVANHIVRSEVSEQQQQQQHTVCLSLRLETS